MPSEFLPTVLIVPGAFLALACYESLISYLREAGFPTRIAPHPSSNHPDPAAATCQEDAASLRDNVLLPLVEKDGKDVVVVAHSYGAIAASGVAKGLDKQTCRARGHADGVVGLISVSGQIPLEGESALSISNNIFPPWIKRDENLTRVDRPMESVFNDCDPALASQLPKLLNSHAIAVIWTPAPAPAWADSGFDGRRVYIRTLDDRSKSAALQKSWIERSKVGWDVVDFQSGQVPFISQPKAIAGRIVKLINGFREP
ncbi:Alpha/Beta hydrolase protein [Hypomontagnella monticulosa]|nr:Alpha/Beta hydrolase protein [Hypomontagnella monticulosa]